ncbi:M48 family metallopeptidase [Skermania sp. ID1734]|uniref:M48 family metallopeptidase n=1 Tax=Skermania sp. ID1734 TaxID=2597516 RepID=UPI001180AB76|nr:M48 family metallopeptidase [Skermania sp. ID1734]TSD99997.1 M48 family metallopeptidase [Skermania sp. ID1734]
MASKLPAPAPFGPAPADQWPQPPAPRSLSPYGRPAFHSWEIPLLVLVTVCTVALYTAGISAVATGQVSDFLLLILLAPVVVFIRRGLTYASPRVNGIQMTPTQFPEGYYLVVEAAQRFGMSYVPDAFVVLGNGQINAFAAGHGFRRFVTVYSDLFEVGGQARNPDALAFIIGHEVGHIAAGHVSYWRQLAMFAMQYLPVLGSSLSRAMEYTADNHGFVNRPQGASGAMATLGAGKYLNQHVGFDELADRARTETGLFVWLNNLLATHPVLTWRAHALRDRSRDGNLFWRPHPARTAPTQPMVTGPAQPPANWTTG